jgi:serine/threonine protein kinase/tetratricopeptide (TPR) repeat protein
VERARPGEVVADRYEIVRPLATGGMGEVLLARQLNLDRLVVLKRAVNEHSGRELRALADEARVAARLHHPNIVSVLDVIDAEANPVVVLELVVGVPLRDVIDRAPGGLPVDVALAIAIDVLRGLAYAHAVRSGDRAGVVHRDIKPRNVMVTFAGVTKLIDFGISRWLDAHPSDRTVSGTQGYMPPEQERGEPVDGRADQYAVGVTLREMLTGDPEPDEARPIADAELAGIVGRASAARAEDRYAGCGDMIAALERCAAARGVQPSAMQVERWMARWFEERRLDLEHHATLETSRSWSRTRPPTPPTVAQSSQRPPRPARLGFAAHGAGAPEDAWLAPVVERMVRRILREREDRRLEVDRVEDAAWIELAFAREGERFRIEARRRGDPQVLVSAAAASVAGAARELAGALEARLGAGLPPLGPDPDELEAMRRIGASSVQLFRRYRNALHAAHGTTLPDAHALTAAARELVAADPAWAHAHALLAFLEGSTTPAGREVSAAGRAAASAARDPSGTSLLRAFELLGAGEAEAAYPLLEDVVRGNDADLLAAEALLNAAVVLHRAEEATALARRLHAQHPELMFGTDLAEAFRREARDADAEREIRQWAAAAPDNVAAHVQLAQIEADAGRLDEARARAREVLAIHRDREDVLPDLFEVLAGTDQISEARAIADRMLVGSPLSRARGRYRTAVTSVFQGRFAAAYDAVRRASAEHRAFGHHSELTQCLELARALAPLVADLDAQRRYTEELAGVFADLIGDGGTAAATRFELALLDRRGDAPSIDEHLAGLEDGPMRDVARRRMLRAAAVADRGSAHQAVAAGFSAFEENTASLVALGLCAWRVRELELARRSLERAARRWSSVTSNQASPYHAVLARFHLGGVLAELGDRAAARAAYEAFLRCWSDPDRPVPEVAVARQVLAGDALAP